MIKERAAVRGGLIRQRGGISAGADDELPRKSNTLFSFLCERGVYKFAASSYFSPRARSHVSLHETQTNSCAAKMNGPEVGNMVALAYFPK